MPAASHPQAKFDPISPDLDFRSLVDEVPNFKWAQRVSRTQLRNLGPQEFEKLVLMHVIIGGKPLVIEGLDAVLPKRLFNTKWLEEHYDKKEERVRDIVSQSDIPMTMGHYLRSMKQLTNQWTPFNFRDERRQRLYLKDIDCPPEWHEALQKIINPVLFYLNSTITRTGSESEAEDETRNVRSYAASAGDLMSSLPREMRAENLMCYIGHEGTYTPAHREMCASLGQNIMVEASGDEEGEKPGSSIWFMTESKDRAVVREYFLSMLGHDIEIEKHFAQVNAWKKAPFDVYVVEQHVGDFILIPPLAAHQVWNRGTRTMKVAWNRTTVETLELALQEALPKARLVCRDEQYKNKAMIYYTLQIYHERLKSLEDYAEKSQFGFIDLGRDAIRNSARSKQLASDFKKLFILFTQVLVDEVFAFKEKEIELIPFDSCITCAYCRANIFNRFLTCKHCVRTLANGDEDTYDVCMECYAMGRSCVCLSGLQWCEQWSWRELVNNHELWRSMVISNDGFIDVNISPQPLEVAKQISAKKSVAQICQEALRRRPWKDITKPERDPTPSDSEEEQGGDNQKAKKSRKKKNKKGDVRRCHVCCRKEFSYRMQMCSNADCSEGYCFGVLYRAFDMMPQEVLQNEHWMCPKCLGICNCGHCRRAGTTKPYTPKNTSLGHDTRAVADDRSVEALVDFRLHNLAWLKAAGEESRGQDTRRMQRLREQADTAKAEGLSNDQPDDDNAEDVMEDRTREALQHERPSELRDRSATHAAADHPFAGAGRNGAESPSLAAPWLVRDSANGQDGEDLSYPDPPVFPAQRIGMGYYEQDDTPDKILFDPYQAPTAEDLKDDEVDIPEFVKRSIRSAKRKARKENEDPDFIVRGHHRKRPRPEREPDFLDSMDPALFNEAPAPSVSETLENGEGGSTEHAVMTQKGDEEPKRGEQPRYDANEPLLRHAKPKASYVEVEDAEIEEINDNEQADTPPAAEADNLPSASVLAGASGSGEGEKVTAPVDAADIARTTAHSTNADRPLKTKAQVPLGASAGPKRRGRPPGATKRPPATNHEAESSPEKIMRASKFSNSNGRRGPGRPRKSASGIPNASKQAQSEEENSEPTTPAEPVQKGDKSRRGRPPASENTKTAPVQQASGAGEQFMSLKERMALRGKAFKIAKRGGRNSPAHSRTQTRSEETPLGFTVQLPSFTPVNTPAPSSQRKETSISSKTVGRSSIDNDTAVHKPASDSDSSDDDDIPARIVAKSGELSLSSKEPRGRASQPQQRDPEVRYRFAMAPSLGSSVAAAFGILLGCGMPFHGVSAADVDTKWYAPSKNQVNDLDTVPTASGVYGFIYNSSKTPDNDYGVYNWCNMPHVRRAEYVKASADYELKYVELIHRHHKRTPYSSNAFPVESYQWNCDDSMLHYYGQPFSGPSADRVYQQGYISPINPFVPSGWIGTCKFPQITAGGLVDSWQHGADLYSVYHDLLGFLPSKGASGLPHSVKYRVTNNLITSQVVGMVINAMWDITEPVPILVQAQGIDSLEPQYQCRSSSDLFNSIKSNSNQQWRQHLDLATDLYRTLDAISGVPASDGGFHESFDHYYDNLSARQCHAKPLPCKLVDGGNSTDCVTQELADAVYRWGNWEYSQIYRDSSLSLDASTGSFGVWIAELTAHIRDVIAGKSNTIYYHNVAHDGSVSRLLSILQIDEMVWPGMGSEVVFELYQKKKQSPPTPTATGVAPDCNHDNCLRHMIRKSATASSYCYQLATETASWPAQCGGSESRVASACSCLDLPTNTASAVPQSTSAPSASGYYVRVLFGGQVMRSSTPALGLMDMIPVEKLLSYFDGLVGENASNIKTKCNGN
ncbi:hypothetical protein PWT90_04464 [Aphanocladium album]|nr:hypothetical protein PWT90_04464 [Aphanocladium album]